MLDVAKAFGNIKAGEIEAQEKFVPMSRPKSALGESDYLMRIVILRNTFL